MVGRGEEGESTVPNVDECMDLLRDSVLALTVLLSLKPTMFTTAMSTTTPVIGVKPSKPAIHDRVTSIFPTLVTIRLVTGAGGTVY